MRGLRMRTASAITLRDSLSGPIGSERHRRVDIEIDSWQPPHARWAARLGPLPGIRRYRLDLPASGSGRVRAVLVLADALPYHLIAAAVLGALGPARALPAPVGADIADDGPLPVWLPPFTGAISARETIRPYDVLVTDGQSTAPVAGALAVRAHPWGIGGVLVDAAYANPRGYSYPDGVGGTLTVEEGRWRISTPQRVICEGPLPLRLLDEGQIAAARSVRSVVAKHLPGRDGGAEAFLLAQLSMSGVVILAERLPAATAELLADELVRIIAEPPPASPMEFRSRSVRQRRAALRHHATALALPSALAALPRQIRLALVSAVVTTPEPTVLAMLAAQTYPNLEIVVGSSPPGLAPAPGPLAAHDGVPGPAGRRRVREVGGDTFAEVVAGARGSLVTRIDPAAAYGPEHIWDLVLAYHYSGAAVVGKACEFFLPQPPGALAHIPSGPAEAFTDSLSAGTMLVARTDLALLAGDAVPPGSVAYRTHPYAFARALPANVAHEPSTLMADPILAGLS